MMELLGRMPKNLALSGKHSKKYFDSRGNLRRIKDLRYWPVKKILTDKYLIKEDEAQAFGDFLLPMLRWHHDKRASAQEMLSHPWLNMPDNYDYKFTKKEYEKIQFKKDLLKDLDPFAEDAKQEMGELIESDPELYMCDNEAKKPRKRRFTGNHDLSSPEDMLENSPWDQLFDSDSDRSLEDPEEFDRKLKAHKKKDVKLNNSFTGPYPSDPTDFNHNDKGANAQFVYYNKL